MSRIRIAAFGVVRRAAPRTVANLERMPDLSARVDELAAENARLRERIAELETSRDEAERFGRRIAELTDVLAQQLGRHGDYSQASSSTSS